jgi:hypothetical protein
MASQLTRVRYAGLDFDTHEDEILARLQVKFAAVFNDFAVSSLGIMLVDIFSFGLDTISFYLDRRATDNFLVTSRTLASATRLSRQLGYKPGPASASSADIQLSLDAIHSFPVTVPIGFQLLGPGGLIFETQEAITFSIGDTATYTVTASEGETLTSVFFSDGTANQVFDVGNVPESKFIVGTGTNGQSQVTVEVDGAAWEEQEFLQFGETDQFEIGYTDEPPTARFGDAIAGKIPETNSEIRVTYFASSGVNGTATAGTITQSVQPLVVGFDSIGLNINNAEGSSGGSDPEDLNSIKANAPGVFKSRTVNVTLEDYKARAQSFVDSIFGAIAVARAINVRGSSDDAFLSSRLTNIRSESGNFVPIIETAVDAINVDTTAITTSVAEAQVDDDSLADDIADIGTAEDAARVANEGNRTASGIISTTSSACAGELGTIDAQHDSIVADINAAPAGAADTISPELLATLLGYLTVMDTARISGTAKTSEIGAQSSTVLSNVTTVTTELDDVDAKAVTAEARRSSIRVDVDAIEVSNTSIVATTATLLLDVQAVDNNINDLVQEVDDHVDSFLSNECKSNLIEVPVLTLDSEGFYVVPTNGLQKSLQTYLDGAKEVTQVVKVTGASNQLVASEITVLVGILTGYSEATVRSQVEAAILDVLRGRAFGAALRLSELYAPVAPETDDIQIEGVEYVNITIVGPSGRIDADGNLPVEEFEVVTRGTITVTSEVVEKSLIGQ